MVIAVAVTDYLARVRLNIITVTLAKEIKQREGGVNATLTVA